jgi:hypothetical protein
MNLKRSCCCRDDQPGRECQLCRHIDGDTSPAELEIQISNYWVPNALTTCDMSVEVLPVGTYTLAWVTPEDDVYADLVDLYPEIVWCAWWLENDDYDDANPCSWDRMFLVIYPRSVGGQTQAAMDLWIQWGCDAVTMLCGTTEFALTLNANFLVTGDDPYNPTYDCRLLGGYDAIGLAPNASPYSPNWQRPSGAATGIVVSVP